MLPAQVVPDVTIENVKAMFNQQTFSWVGSEMGIRDRETLAGVKYAIVHRFEVPHLDTGLRLFIFSFFDHSRGWQEHSFPTLHSAFPPQLLCERVQAFGADIVFFARNFLLQALFCFAAEIAH